MKAPGKNNPYLAPALYAGCGLLVFGYVNMYSLFRLVNDHLGSSFVLVVPVLLPLLLLCAIALRRRTQGAIPATRRWWLFAGLFLLLLSLVLPDPRFAVKRIHAAEYLLLSLIVRYAMSRQLTGQPLLVFSCLLCSLYGVHDELLQGLHPLRTYGLRDMLVNMVAANGGCLLWHGLSLFDRDTPEIPGNIGWQTVHVYSLIWLCLAVAALVVPLTVYRYSRMPWWPFLPLAAAMISWLLLLRGDRSALLRHGIAPLYGVALPLLCYPPAVNYFKIPFN